MKEAVPQGFSGPVESGATYRVEQQDLLAAIRCHRLALFKRWRTYRILAIVGVALFLLGLLQDGDPVRAGIVAGRATLVAICALFAWMIWSIPRVASRTYAQQRDLHGEVTKTWSSAGLHTVSDTSESRIPWDHFLRWTEDKRVVLLYRSDTLFDFTPKRLLSPGGAAALRALAAAAGVPGVERAVTVQKS